MYGNNHKVNAEQKEIDLYEQNKRDMDSFSVIIRKYAEITKLMISEVKMLTIFNRKIIFTSFSMEEQANIRNLLDNHGIKYYVKVVNRRSSSTLDHSARARTGSFGENPSYTYEYIIYVHKKDFELANKYIYHL